MTIAVDTGRKATKTNKQTNKLTGHSYKQVSLTVFYRALENFIRAKYETKKYIAKEWIPPKPTVPKEVRIL